MSSKNLMSMRVNWYQTSAAAPNALAMQSISSANPQAWRVAFLRQMKINLSEARGLVNGASSPISAVPLV
jgi:hypothetical protein